MSQELSTLLTTLNGQRSPEVRRALGEAGFLMGEVAGGNMFPVVKDGETVMISYEMDFDRAEMVWSVQEISQEDEENS